ncbi:UDP-N-acetylglucosamine 2-epimerase [Patescibacteria group bacterium]|nr:UDP-N-acetylglucosamine 2-epimerase [Patescibacteria group bacterium]
MIHIIIGTKAQLIKVAPLMKELQDRGVDYNFIISGQHKETMDDLMENFGVKKPDIVLYSGPDIVKVSQMIAWGGKIIFKFLKNKKEIFKDDKNGIVINHGDTFTTLLGSILAKLAGLKNSHLESGLRSFNFFHPFPEEIFRYLTFHLTDYYFCPGAWAMGNLEKYKGKKIDTIYNTLYDSVKLAIDSDTKQNLDIPQEKFAIVSLHRFENVFKKNRFLSLIELIEDTADSIKLLFILHPPTKDKLRKFDFYNRLKNNKNIELRPRYDYFDFIKLMDKAEFIITDGGSNQEESFYLGKPCLILRQKTERQEGLGQNAVLSGYNKKTVEDFVSNYYSYKLYPKDEAINPSRIVANFLIQNFL